MQGSNFRCFQSQLTGHPSSTYSKYHCQSCSHTQNNKSTHVCTMLLMIRKFRLTRKAIVLIVFIAVYISVISVSPGWCVWKSRLNSSKHKQSYICQCQFMFRISIIATSIPLKPYLKGFCWGISNISHG